MPVTITADRLENLIAQIFRRTSCDDEEAALIAHYLVDADLAGMTATA
jgi:LDH2 family malate/lactate/ureidoglycolate dehydrogenase